MLDEEEFLGPHGIRALSRFHADNPYILNINGQEHQVGYLPAESDTGMFGGNSNWRGPVWFPINIMLVRSLLWLHGYFGEEFTVECPTGSGKQRNLYEVAQEIGGRLIATFTRGAGRPPSGARRAAAAAKRPALARPAVVLRVLPRGQRRRDRRQPPDRLDRAGRGAAPAVPDRDRRVGAQRCDRHPRAAAAARRRNPPRPAGAGARRPRARGAADDRVAGPAGDLRGQHRDLARRPVPRCRAAGNPRRRARLGLG